MNISELSRRLKITTSELKQIIPLLGFDVGMRAIKVDQKVAQEILSMLSKPEALQRYRAQIAASTKQTPEEPAEPAPHAEGVLEIPSQLSVKQFADLIHQPATNVILLLMRNGVMAAQNELIDFETASILAQDLGFKTTKADHPTQVKKLVDVKKELSKAMAGKHLESRPPVVVVMGHVDHGKTSLLDAIRKSHVVEKEAGGITQHIGAYQVTVSSKDESSSRVSEANRGIPRPARDDFATSNRKITFIDTPGHEAFTAMRSRGAKIADIAILVVAADDGVQPQTIEALSHIQRSELPFLVAINKIDKEDANPDRVMTSLSDVGVIPEDWGGTIPFVKIAAKKLEGIDSLLNIVLLLADLHKENITAHYEGRAMGSVIETHVDRGEGPVATVLVQSGILHQNDYIIIGDSLGKIKAMRSDSGKTVSSAPPSMPVRILGLRSVPTVGELLRAVPESEWRQASRKLKKTERSTVPSLVHLERTRSELPKIPVVVKADFLGSLEAIKEAFETIERQGVDIVYNRKDLGMINEADVETALATGSIILGFNTEASKEAGILAQEKGINIVTSRVIYDLVDVIQKKTGELLGPKIIMKEKGNAVIKVIFRQDKKSAIVGCAVTSGILRKGGVYHVVRGTDQVGECGLVELQSRKLPIEEAAEGSECGLKLTVSFPVQVNDEIVYSIQETRQRR